MDVDEPEKVMEMLDPDIEGDFDDLMEPSEDSQHRESTVPDNLQAWAIPNNILENAEPYNRNFGQMTGAILPQRIDEVLRTVKTNTRSNDEGNGELGYHRLAALKAIYDDINPSMVCRVPESTIEATHREFEEQNLADYSSEKPKLTNKGKAILEGFSPLWNSHEDETHGISEVGYFIRSLTGDQGPDGERLLTFMQMVETDKGPTELSRDVESTKRTIENWYDTWSNDYDLFRGTLAERNLTITGGRNYAILSYTIDQLDQASEENYIKSEF